MHDQYAGMDGLAVGEEVENMVLQLYANQTIHKVVLNSYNNFHQNYHTITQQALHNQPDIIYQPWFFIDNFFVKCDILKKNKKWKYDLIEVKSKNSIRKKSTHEPLLDDINYDVSFQHFVLSKAIPDMFSGNTYVYYLNKEFIKDGPIDPELIIKQEEVTQELIDVALIEHIINAMRLTLTMTKEEFDTHYPYNAEDHLLYFGEPAPKWSIFTIPRIKSSKKKFLDLLHKGKLFIKDLDDADIFALWSKEWEENSFTKFVHMYKNDAEHIAVQDISTRLSHLQFPLHFYDYETISTPIPILDKTSPWQQVVVQYSMHTLHADGQIEHKYSIMQAGQETNKNLIQQFTQDCPQEGTYIVRNKSFECGRNTEMMKMFPEYQETLEYINNHTFDLMEIFKENEYFHPDFGGSYSIKKVLPVLTDISYDGLAVSDGGIATDLLQKLIKNTLENHDVVVNNLLEYCKQDTRAMVAIYQHIIQKIGQKLTD